MKKRIEEIIPDMANRAVQEVMNKGQKLTSAEQIGLNSMLIEIGNSFLTELLSNAEGEVVEHPVTLDGMCPKCKAELQINGILRIPSQPQKVERV